MAANHASGARLCAHFATYLFVECRLSASIAATAVTRTTCASGS